MTNKQIGVDLEFIFPGKVKNLAPPNQPGDATSKQYVDEAIDGVSGINAFTTTTASFLVPAVNSNVTVAVAESRWMVVGQILFTEFGSFRVQSIVSETSVSLTNLTGTQGASIASGTKLSPSGERGIQGIQGIQGNTGPANTLTIGTVTTGTAAATITGTAPNQTLNLTIPQGPQGIQGIQGIQGQPGVNSFEDMLADIQATIVAFA